jgi:hypothetical protein
VNILPLADHVIAVSGDKLQALTQELNKLILAGI